MPLTVVCCLKIIEDKASNAGLMSTRGLHFNSNADITLHQQHNARVAFYAKRDGRASLQNADIRVAFQYQNVSLSTFAFQLQREPVSSAFLHRRESVSSASQHQSEVRVY